MNFSVSIFFQALESLLSNKNTPVSCLVNITRALDDTLKRQGKEYVYWWKKCNMKEKSVRNLYLIITLSLFLLLFLHFRAWGSGCWVASALLITAQTTAALHRHPATAFCRRCWGNRWKCENTHTHRDLKKLRASLEVVSWNLGAIPVFLSSILAGLPWRHRGGIVPCCTDLAALCPVHTKTQCFVCPGFAWLPPACSGFSLPVGVHRGWGG